MKQLLRSKGLKLNSERSGKRWWEQEEITWDLQSSGRKWEKNQRNEDQNEKDIKTKRH